MEVEQVQVIAAALALVAALIAVVCAVTVVAGSRLRLDAEWRQTIAVAAPWLAWSIAVVATLGSLYFSEIADYTPCKLCWYQRIAMYPLAVILLVAAVRRDRTIVWTAVPVAAIGAAIAVYHYAVEWRPSLEAVCDPFNPCSIIWFRRFGFVTLPFMALCGFLAIIGLLLVAHRQSPTAQDPT